MSKEIPVGFLISRTAHELNNPLAAVIGCAELLKRKMESGTPVPIALVDEILNQADRCRRVLSSLIQISIRDNLLLQKTDINALIREALGKRIVDGKIEGITVHLDLDPCRPSAYVDSDKLLKVLTLLLDNSLHVIRDGKKEGNIWLQSCRRDNAVFLELRDDGQRFSFPDKAFSPFDVEQESDKRIGLGLMICSDVVEKHRGTIEAGNWEKGAFIRILLPTGMADEPAP